MTYTATIRQRGQLTIPYQIRKLVSWLQTGSAVEMEVRDDEVIIRPYSKVDK